MAINHSYVKLPEGNPCFDHGSFLNMFVHAICEPKELHKKIAHEEMPIPLLRTMVLVYLPTKLGDFVRVNVGMHIPAPWFPFGLYIYISH
jgi:hypothetical protein